MFWRVLTDKDVPTVLALPLNDKAKKVTKRKRTMEDCGEMAKRRSARVRNTKSKKEEKIDFQELLLKFLPPRYQHAFFKTYVCLLKGSS